MGPYLQGDAPHFPASLVCGGPAVRSGTEAANNLADEVVLGPNVHSSPAQSQTAQACVPHGDIAYVGNA